MKRAILTETKYDSSNITQNRLYGQKKITGEIAGNYIIINGSIHWKV